MPGLCLVADRPGHGHGETRREALAELCHFDHYRAATVREGETWVAYTAYPGYPTRTFEARGITCYVEGKLYGGPTTDDEIVSVLEAGLAGSTDGIADWLTDVDGEFVLCGVDADGNAVVVNDAFGRLPLYLARNDDGVVLSREPRFPLSLLETPYDDLGLAETLLFGYTLGNRTLWEELERVPGGTALAVRDGEVATTTIHEFDFDDPEHDARSTAENAAAMADLFVDACRSRAAAGAEAVVSLSGGHDSRAVATGLHTAGRPFSTATFCKTTAPESADARIAEEVARELDVEWRRYELPPVRGAEMKTLLQIEAGLNHLGMAFILPFLESLRERHGPRATYFTGDGGDKAVPDLSPPRTFEDLDDLAEYVVTQNAVFPATEASELTGINESRLRREVRRVLASYPESDLGRKYVHFLVHERGFNWLFEGEDRNRAYLWSTTPFYSLPFFEYAMNVPDEQKERNGLYREFLSELWSPSVTFEDADFGTPMASRRYDLVQYGLETLDRHPRLKAVARTVYRGELLSRYHSAVSDLLIAQRSRCPELATVFDGVSIDAVADDRSEYGRQQVFTLLTLTTVVDHDACDTPLSAIPDDQAFEGDDE